MDKEVLKKAIDIFGGQSKLAHTIGVNPVQVHDWMNGKRPIPAHICSLIEGCTNGIVTRKDLRPDDWYLIWPELIKTNEEKVKIEDYLEQKRLEISIKKNMYLQKVAIKASKNLEVEKKRFKELTKKIK